MDLTKEERLEKAYDIFNELFNLDLKSFSPEKKRIAVDELNNRLKKAIKEEKEKQEKINNEIILARNNIIELLQELKLEPIE